MSDTSKRLLIAAHSHPAITKGGAEIAAWRLYEAIAARRDWQAWRRRPRGMGTTTY